MTLIEITGKETDGQCEEIAWQMMCNAHPIEAHAYDPERFWKYFHSLAPGITREKMVSVLNECDETEAM